MTQCSVTSCQRDGAKRGMCRTHYMQWKRTGETWPIGTNPHRGRKTCTFEGCDRFNFAHGLCGAHAKQKRLGQELRPIRPGRPEDRDEQRWCSTCKQFKANYLFPPNPPGRMPRTCDDCAAAAMRVYNAKPEVKMRVRWQRAEKKYGISQEAYQRFWQKQGGKCAICKVELDDILSVGADQRYKSAIDHDHDTGAVRGLLCGSCNCAIGYMQDDPSRLEAAARYLREAAAAV